MPGDRKHHTDKFRRCVEQVMAKGHDESSAYAICTTSLQEAGEPIFEAAEEHVMNEMRQLHLRGATGAVRVAMHEGREHLVVPVVALMDGVIHAVNAATPERVTIETLRKAAPSWNGRPVVLGHPTRGGRQCSANDPAIIESHGIGTIFNSHVEGLKLLMEAWVDVAKATALKGAEFVRSLRDAEPCEVSVGAFVTTDPTPGTHPNGKAYKATWLETFGDHLAMLPGGRGACSLEMGCGAHRAAMHIVTAEGIVAEEEGPVTIKDRISTFLRSLMPRGWGDDEVKQELRDALLAVEPMSRNGEIVRVTNDRIIYCLYPPSYPSAVGAYDQPAPLPLTYWSRDYSFDTATQKFNVAVERVRVEPTTHYEPMRAAKAGYEDCEACHGTGQMRMDDKQMDCESCGGTGEVRKQGMQRAAERCEEGQMTKEQRAAAIKALTECPCSGFTTADLKMLESADDARIEAFRTAAEARKKEIDDKAKADADIKAAADKAAADLKAAQEKAKTVEERLTAAEAAVKAASERTYTEDEFLKIAPPSIRTLVEEKKAADAAAKATLVASLKAAGAFTEEELNAKDIPELTKLAALAQVPVADYSGRGLPPLRGAADYTPPDPYEKGIKALQTGTVN